MSDDADDFWDRMQDNHESRVACPNGHVYVEDGYGCPVCETPDLWEELNYA